MTERITQDMLEGQLARTNEAISNADPDMRERLVDILELHRAYGGVQIVRADNGNPLTKYGSRREAYNALEMMRKTVDILNGY